MPSLCRDCITPFDAGRRCPSCGSPRVVSHPELFELAIAHMDCDAFYASVEQRDNPRLQGRPVIVGEGVVMAASYEARACGVRSAMNGRQARELCPHAVVVPPRMEAYSEASDKVFDLFRDVTPFVEPISVDEAFLEVGGFGELGGIRAGLRATFGHGLLLGAERRGKHPGDEQGGDPTAIQRADGGWYLHFATLS